MPPPRKASPKRLSAGTRGETQLAPKRGTGLESPGNPAGRPRRGLPLTLEFPVLAGVLRPGARPRLVGDRFHGLGGIGVLQSQDDAPAVGGCFDGGEERTIQIHTQSDLPLYDACLLWHLADVRLPAGPHPACSCNLGPEPPSGAGGALPRRSVRRPIQRIQETRAALDLRVLGRQLLVRSVLDRLARLIQSPQYLLDLVLVSTYRYVVPSDLAADSDFQKRNVGFSQKI